MTPVAVTGMGIAAPNGLGRPTTGRPPWAPRAASAASTRFDPSGYPAQLAGEIPGFRAAEHLPGRLVPQTDRVTRLSLAAADWALADAGVEVAAFDPLDMGVVTASHAGGFEFGQDELQKLLGQGQPVLSAYQSFAWFYAVNSGQISIRHGMKGPSGVVVSDQAGGLDALAQARRLVRKGTPLIVCGAVEPRSAPGAGSPSSPAGGMSDSDEPNRAYLPFDRDGRGYVPGGGRGVVPPLERAEAAPARGAEVYGEAGPLARLPAPHSGRGSTRAHAIRTALDDAGTAPGDIRRVFADGGGRYPNDRAEAEAISEVFGPGRVPVTCPRTMTGRLHSGAAPLDVACALLAMRAGVIPPTVHIDPCPEYDLDLVLYQVRPAALRTALGGARGHGGFNSALVVRAGQ
uniref:Putative polyketide beta-ketoacyl synthase 2 n=1 Tax=Streptomyces virginiae TaxID=1961 RepID=KAS2_STRVG|nr:RecName: Full=Putative polyketide beta-ketoacyl synthase 2; AltName: Full=ORF 2 [Streptomyces virginiae]CAA77597.1 Beta Ketoacyl Synthase Subunit [Streptomyces virginiae]